MQNITEYELPDDVEHEEFDIIRIYHNDAIDSVFVEYEDDEVNLAPLQLQFGAEENNGSIDIIRTAMGLISPNVLDEHEGSSLAQSSRQVYDILQEIGFNVRGYEE
jgi:hypothetical protein